MITDWKNNVTGFRIAAEYFTPEGYRLANGFTGLTILMAADMAYLAFQVNSVDFAVAAGIGSSQVFGEDFDKILR